MSRTPYPTLRNIKWCLFAQHIIVLGVRLLGTYHPRYSFLTIKYAIHPHPNPLPQGLWLTHIIHWTPCLPPVIFGTW
jgi:hypothetical protein